jgi:hypothetical protein
MNAMPRLKMSQRNSRPDGDACAAEGAVNSTVSIAAFNSTPRCLRRTSMGFGVSNRQWEGRELSKDHQMLLLTGDLTIKSSMQTKRLIEEAFAGATIDQSMLSVDIADEHAADLTLAQLLLSAKNTADREKIVFRLAHPAVGSLLTVLERGGLIGAGCPDNDFWLHEGIA